MRACTHLEDVVAHLVVGDEHRFLPGLDRPVEPVPVIVGPRGGGPQPILILPILQNVPALRVVRGPLGNAPFEGLGWWRGDFRARRLRVLCVVRASIRIPDR